jgi:hypothetical protein
MALVDLDETAKGMRMTASEMNHVSSLSASSRAMQAASTDDSSESILNSVFIVPNLLFTINV